MDKLFKNIKKQMQESSEPKGKYACKNKFSIYYQPDNSDIRSSYFKDIDRIIHSLAYTRYVDKTQVYVNLHNDLISKRIIHVTLVSKIARTIGRALKLNEDLIEAIALGHDIGHIPFGHEGEYILNEISLENDLGYFNHNVQSMRTFLYIEKENLTVQTLDGILCHNGELVLGKYTPVSKTKEQLLEEYEKTYLDKSVTKKLHPMTLEGCVVRISDMIAYLGRDIEDSINIGTFKRENIPLNISNVLGNNNSKIVNTIILDIIKNSYNKPYIKISDEVYHAISSLKDFNYNNIYSKANTLAEKEEYKKQFKYLFNILLEEIEYKNIKSHIYTNFINKMDNQYLDNNCNKRIVLDYICGMTDRYFIDEYKYYVDKNDNK